MVNTSFFDTSLYSTRNPVPPVHAFSCPVSSLANCAGVYAPSVMLPKYVVGPRTTRNLVFWFAAMKT